MQKPIILGYISDGNPGWSAEDENFAKLTHINYAFATLADRNGTVVERWSNINKLMKIKEKYPHIKTLFSIGGARAGNFTQSAETEEGRKRISKTAIEIMKKYKFDGIDLDWEFPCLSYKKPNLEGVDLDWEEAEQSRSYPGVYFHPDDKYNLTLLLEQIRTDLNELEKKDNCEYLLTIATGPNDFYIDNCEIKKLGQILDFINVMTYDMCSSQMDYVTGHHTNIYNSSRTPHKKSGAYFMELFMKHGVPANKLVLGAAFYGLGSNGVENRGDGLTNRVYGVRTQYYNYTRIKTEILKEDSGFKAYWDDEAKAPYVFNGDTFITYENPESLKHKVEYVKEKGFLGVFFWEYPLDQTGELLDTIYNEVNKK